MSSRTEILSLLNGRKPAHPPAFSGLIHITSAGLERENLSFPEIHLDPQKMARASASTFRLTGLPSATLPLDLCVEAEALGAEIDFRENAEYDFPLPVSFKYNSINDLDRSGGFSRSNDSDDLGRSVPSDLLLTRARLPIVLDAIALLKQDIGDQVVISGMLPGPFTILTLITEPASLFMQMKRDPEIVNKALFHLSTFLARVGQAYRSAGADFITIHEMGGSPGFLGPARFESFVLPALQKLISNLPEPRVLSVCGDTNSALHLLARAGADAISVDQTNHLSAARAALPDTLLFGNIDPVRVLAHGTQLDVHQAVESAIAAGVDAVWPGCDLFPRTSIENLKSLSPAL